MLFPGTPAFAHTHMANFTMELQSSLFLLLHWTTPSMPIHNPAWLTPSSSCVSLQSCSSLLYTASLKTVTSSINKTSDSLQPSSLPNPTNGRAPVWQRFFYAASTIPNLFLDRFTGTVVKYKRESQPLEMAGPSPDNFLAFLHLQFQSDWKPDLYPQLCGRRTSMLVWSVTPLNFCCISTPQQLSTMSTFLHYGLPKTNKACVCMWEWMSEWSVCDWEREKGEVHVGYFCSVCWHVRILILLCA